jgi:hypothetical protein
VYEHKAYAKSTKVLYRGENEEKAVEILLGG